MRNRYTYQISFIKGRCYTSKNNYINEMKEKSLINHHIVWRDALNYTLLKYHSQSHPLHNTRDYN